MVHRRITKEIVEDELYLYFDGILVYKRWLNRNYGRVFHEKEGLTQFINGDENGVKRQT